MHSAGTGSISLGDPRGPAQSLQLTEHRERLHRDVLPREEHSETGCTYFSRAWLSEGTTAPLPLPYMLVADVSVSEPGLQLSKEAPRHRQCVHSSSGVVLSLLRSLPSAPLFSTSPTLPTNQELQRGNLKPSTGGAFFFFNRCSSSQPAPLRAAAVGAS